MFKISYHSGPTLSASYFIGQEGQDARIVKADAVIPAEVQTQITESELGKGEEAKGVITPEEAIAQITTACGNTLEGFKKWADELAAPVAEVVAAPAVEVAAAPVTEPAAVPAPEVKAEAQPGMTKEAKAGEDAAVWSFDKSEVKQPPLPKAGEVIKTVDSKEVKAEETDLPKDRSSQVKKYYNRLPSTGVGEPAAVTINKESSVNEKYQFALKALNQLKAEKEELVNKVNVLSDEKKKVEDGKIGVEKELGKVKDELDVDKKKGEVDKIVVVLKKELGIAGDEEKAAVDILVKLDQKALKAVSDLMKALFKDEGKAPAGLPPMKMASAHSGLSGENLPQVGSVVGTDLSLIEIVSKSLNHN